MRENRDDSENILMRRVTSQNSGRSQRGFTMVELLVVISIILIITAIALPSLPTFFRSYKLRNDARTLAGQISAARMLASENTKRALVTCNTTTKICQIGLRGLDDTALTWRSSGSAFIARRNGLQVALSGSDTFGPPGTAGLARLPIRLGRLLPARCSATASFSIHAVSRFTMRRSPRLAPTRQQTGGGLRTT